MENLNSQEKEIMDELDNESRGIVTAMLYMGATPDGSPVTSKQINQFCEWAQSISDGMQILDALRDKKILARFIDGDLETQPMTEDGGWDDDFIYDEDEEASA